MPKEFKGMQLFKVSGPPALILIDGHPYVMATRATKAVGSLEGLYNVEVVVKALEEETADAPVA